ncbi:MAG: NTP transferase domain-containing protein [Planctomycetota bacterium]|nr:NTP transferase domain-containing protein [Planctomycetota bacterium]
MRSKDSPRLAGVVLAAGKGKRMKSRKAKVLHALGGRPMLWHVLRAMRTAGIRDVCVVTGFQAAAVRRVVRPLLEEIEFPLRVEWVNQHEQLGTAHALMAAEPVFVGDDGEVPFEKTKRILVVCGDVPLIRPATLEAFVRAHESEKVACSVMTTIPEKPGNYGRIVRGPDGDIESIVEARDASETERAIREINAGVYIFESPAVFRALQKVGCDNAKCEYYLTDVVAVLNARGDRVMPFLVLDSLEVLGINDRRELAGARELIAARG